MLDEWLRRLPRHERTWVESALRQEPELRQGMERRLIAKRDAISGGKPSALENVLRHERGEISAFIDRVSAEQIRLKLGQI